MAEAAPGAVFQFIAHLPDRGISFPIRGNGWSGGLPTVIDAEGHTVWGAVFDVPDGEIDGLHEAERAEQRVPRVVEAMDRMGRRHEVVTHVYDGEAATHPPSSRYVGIMLAGSRHWELPAGWIAGLEEHLSASS